MKSVNGFTATSDPPNFHCVLWWEDIQLNSYVGQFFIALAIYLVFDVAWLLTAGRTIYFTELAGMLKDRPNFLLAFSFYVLFVMGLVGFVIHPAAAANDVWQALKMGAFFGLVAYATYDLTNLASLKGFTIRIAMIDLAWGTALSATVSGATILVLRLLRLE
jgi:uncharacterized membrane protein